MLGLDGGAGPSDLSFPVPSPDPGHAGLWVPGMLCLCHRPHCMHMVCCCSPLVLNHSYPSGAWTLSYC